MQHKLHHVAHIHKTSATDGPELQPGINLSEKTRRTGIPKTAAENHGGIYNCHWQSLGMGTPYLLLAQVFADGVATVALALYPFGGFIQLWALFRPAERSDAADVDKFLNTKV